MRHPVYKLSTYYMFAKRSEPESQIKQTNKTFMLPFFGLFFIINQIGAAIHVQQHMEKSHVCTYELYAFSMLA